jgi:hypothetical protein
MIYLCVDIMEGKTVKIRSPTERRIVARHEAALVLAALTLHITLNEIG